MHAIRLRGPWRYQPLSRTVLLPDGSTQQEPGDLPAAGEIQIPNNWTSALEAAVGADFRGRVLFIRRFGKPQGLSPNEQVWLVVEQVDAFGQAVLNDVELGNLTHEIACFEVTHLLQARNELKIEVELPRITAESAALQCPQNQAFSSDGQVGVVRLEIRP